MKQCFPSLPSCYSPPRLVVLEAARALDEVGNKAARGKIAAAKALAPTAALRIIDRAIQVRIFWWMVTHFGGGYSLGCGLRNDGVPPRWWFVGFLAQGIISTLSVRAGEPPVSCWLGVSQPDQGECLLSVLCCALSELLSSVKVLLSKDRWPQLVVCDWASMHSAVYTRARIPLSK